MPKVYLPTVLRPLANGQATLELSGDSVAEVLDELVRCYPDVRNHLFEERGNIRNFINIFVNEDDIRFLAREQTRVTAQDEVSIVPSVAGGSASARNSVALGPAELLRYSRHIILPEVGLQGQKKLKAASVLIIGAGGLGSPLTMYLAAAGVGCLGLVDFDVVDASNLQRQVIHKTADIGRPKLASARQFIEQVNPHVRVETHETALTAANARDIVAPYDIIIDGTDNFPTRYLVNDVCVLLGKPNVYGSIFRFEGQASVFSAPDGPCYRCLYPEPPPPGLVPSCAEGGVLGVLPGVIGMIQATEAIKLILGKGEPLIGRLLLYDALSMRFREVRLRKDPQCKLCSANRTIHELIDYAAFCGVPAATHSAAETDGPYEISATELAEKLRGGSIYLLDIREPQEWALCSIEGAAFIPLGELQNRLDEIDASRNIVAYCRTGVRSLRALEILHRAGFTSAKHLKGGIHAWSREIDPSLPRY